jgi:hypothetical protein
LEDWGKNWPKSTGGPFQDFSAAYNHLLMEMQVTFPSEQRKAIKSPAHKMMRKD